MAMEYPIKPDAEFQKLHVGDKITATVIVGDPAYYVTDIKVLPNSYCCFAAALAGDFAGTAAFSIFSGMMQGSVADMTSVKRRRQDRIFYTTGLCFHGSLQAAIPQSPFADHRGAFLAAS
jgi:hypothetical protein